MAIFHICAKMISRAGGRSSVAAAAYRSGTELVDQRTGEIHNFTAKEGVLSSEILAPAGAPDWVCNRADLWNSVEERERRNDAQVARDFVLALPSELDDDQRRGLVTSFVSDEFVSRGMVADVAIHRPSGRNDDRNEHAHVMLTLRRLHGNGWSNKERAWNDCALLRHWRESWASAQNQALAKAGVGARVDHRSLAAQGSIRIPTIHEGWGPAAVGRKAQNDEIRQANNELCAAEFELAEAQADVEAARRQEADELIERARTDAESLPAPANQKVLRQVEGRLDEVPINTCRDDASGPTGGASGEADETARAAGPVPTPTQNTAAHLAVAKLRTIVQAATAERAALSVRINDLRRRYSAAGARIKAAQSAGLEADRNMTALLSAGRLPTADHVARAQRNLDLVVKRATAVQDGLAHVSGQLERLGIFRVLRRRQLQEEAASLRQAAKKLDEDRPRLVAIAATSRTHEDAQADRKVHADRRTAAREQEIRATREAAEVLELLTQASEGLADLTRRINDATERLDEWATTPAERQMRTGQSARGNAEEEAEAEVVPNLGRARPPPG